MRLLSCVRHDAAFVCAGFLIFLSIGFILGYVVGIWELSGTHLP